MKRTMKQLLIALVLCAFAATAQGQGKGNAPVVTVADEPKAPMLVRMVDATSLTGIAPGLAKQHSFTIEAQFRIVPAFRANWGRARLSSFSAVRLSLRSSLMAPCTRWCRPSRMALPLSVQLKARRRLVTAPAK